MNYLNPIKYIIYACLTGSVCIAGVVWFFIAGEQMAVVYAAISGLAAFYEIYAYIAKKRQVKKRHDDRRAYARVTDRS